MIKYIYLHGTITRAAKIFVVPIVSNSLYVILHNCIVIMGVGARVAIVTIVITTAVRARHETVSSEKRQKFLLSWLNNQNNGCNFKQALKAALH